MSKVTRISRRVNLESGYAEAVVLDDEGLLDDVEVGDRLLPAAIDVTFPGVGGQPGLSMRLEVVDGIPQCRAVHIESVTGGRPVRQLDLKAVRLAEWVDDIFAMFASRITERHENGSPAAAVHEELTTERHSDAVRQFRDSRKGQVARKLDDAFLAGVADTYRKHFDEGPTKAVASTYGVQPRTAALYVQRAREAGHLGPTIQGKKGV